MKKHVCRYNGFSLIELMIAILIMALVVVGTLYVYLMSLSAWKEGSTQITLQRKASTVMEKMVRGIDGQNGIRESSSVSITASGDNIEYISGVYGQEGEERSFYLSGTDIMYDPDTTTPDDEYAVAENVSDLIFSASGDIVNIDLNMSCEAGSKNMTVNIFTVVELRN